MKCFFFVMLAIFFSLLGCQTTQKKDVSLSNEGYWHGQALIKDIATHKSAVVGLDVNAKLNESFRMDVTSPLGQPIASLVMTSPKLSQLTYVLFDEKKYYRGEANEKSLLPILPIPLNPQLLNLVFFEKKLDPPQWKCRNDSSGKIYDCQNQTLGIVIKWKRRGSRKFFEIYHEKSQVQIKVTNVQPKVEDQENLFQLNPPKSFLPILK